MQRPPVFAGFDFLVGLCRLREGQLFGDRHHAIELRPELLQAVQVHPGQVRRRDLAALNEWRQRGDRKEGEIVERGVPRSRGLQRDLDLCSRSGPRLWPLPREIRPKRHRRLGVERNVDGAKLIEGVEIAIDGRECLLFLGVREVDAEDLLAALQHLLVDSARLLRRRLRKRRGG